LGVSFRQIVMSRVNILHHNFWKIKVLMELVYKNDLDFMADTRRYDGTWYSFVSLAVGSFGIAKSLARHSMLLNRVSAGFYLIIAGLSLSQMIDQSV
jgi:hypothetical protein